MVLSLKELLMENMLEEETMRLTEDSVDSQIDSVLLKYQDESSLEDEELNEGYKMPENWNLLLEADEEEGAQPAGAEDIMSVGDEIPRSKTPADPREQKINIDDFAQKVANLYNNYQNLLNIKPVVVHRAMHMLENGYSQDVVSEFLEILEREFGITMHGDAEDEIPPAPAGGVTGPMGGV